MIADIYDFDKTVYKNDSSLDFFIFCLKEFPEKVIPAMPKQLLGALKFGIGINDLTQFKASAFGFLKYVNGSMLAEKFWRIKDENIYPWFNPKLSDVPVVVCSASPLFEIEPILKRLGVYKIIATEMDVNTGKISGKNCKGEEKVRRIKKELPDVTFRNAYTDNILSDSSMLSLAENKFEVRSGKVIPIK